MRGLPRLFVLGDSISIQYGPYLQAQVAGRFVYERKQGLAAALVDLDLPTGANGGDSRMCREWLTHDPVWSGADVLALNCGLHDLRLDPATGAHQVEPADYEANLGAICDLVLSAVGRLVWLRITPIDDARACAPGRGFHRYDADVDRYNAIADRVMAAAGVAICDLHACTDAFGVEAFCDHAHFIEPVRMAQAAYIAGFLAS